MVGRTGFEPVTTALKVQYPRPLDQRPKFTRLSALGVETCRPTSVHNSFQLCFQNINDAPHIYVKKRSPNWRDCLMVSETILLLTTCQICCHRQAYLSPNTAIGVREDVFK